MPSTDRSAPRFAVAEAVVGPDLGATVSRSEPAGEIKTRPLSSHPEPSPPGVLALPEVLTVSEAAALLRVNVKTLYAEIAARRVRVIRLGRTVRIPRAVVTALLAGK